MTKQAQVGVFAILALLLLFGVFYVITDYGTRHNGYRTGVHFRSAAGLSTGALVYYSGVTAGSVDSIDLLPDGTVSTILAINRDIDIPRNSKFLIQAPLTGSPNLLIVPPAPIRAGEPTLEHRVLPVDQQPLGTNTATAADLMEEGQGEIRRLDSIMADIERREPRMMDTLAATMTNANLLTANANRSVQQLSSRAQEIADTLQASLGKASDNVVALTDTLNGTVGKNSPKVDRMLSELESTSVALNKSSQSLQQFATNKSLHDSIVATTQNLADTTQTISELARDLRTITGNGQTQAQMRDTVANLDASAQRTASLLGALGGTSRVYGVDAGATPAPSLSASPYPNPQGEPTANPAVVRSHVRGIISNLAAVQVRLGELSSQKACCLNPLLSSDRGPQTDINAVIFPHGGTSVMLGANDIGGARTTANAAVLRSVSPGVRMGGGVLYSRLGLIGQFNTRLFGVEGRYYDPRHPMLDLYGNLQLAPGYSLFAGERDLTHPERRSVYGVQLQF